VATRPEIQRQKYRGTCVFTRKIIVWAVVSIDKPDEPTEKAGNVVGPRHISRIKDID
jgi:hypothetical protein